MIKAIIVDDEAKSRTTLNSLLSTYCKNVDVLATADSVASAISEIDKHKPDLVFLDIEMPHGNGFTLFEKIPQPDFEVIFTTAYDQYAIKAIKCSALDYLLKPIDGDDLISAVNKIEDKQKNKAEDKPNFELLLSNISLKGKSAKIAIPTFEGLQMISVEHIVKCTAQDSYTYITLVDGTKHLVSRILKEYDELLSDMNFFRVHHSCLINLAHVVKYMKGDGGYVVMTNGESVEVSRRKKNELLTLLAMVRT